MFMPIKVSSLLTKINPEQRQHEIEFASAEVTTSTSDFDSRTFSSTVIGRISSEILSEYDVTCEHFTLHLLRSFMFVLHSFCTYSQIGFIKKWSS